MPDQLAEITRAQEIRKLRKVARHFLYKAKTREERAAIIRDTAARERDILNRGIIE